jgi:small-conductance mechanosensitive channel
MKSAVRRYLYFILAGITYLIIHEGVHIIQALIFGIYKGIKVLPLGIEVVIMQPPIIEGYKLAAFSGLSSVVTVLIGYGLFAFAPKILKLDKQSIKNYLYYVTFLFLLLDPVYISLLSFIVGGDINGIALGLDIPYMIVRCIYFVIAVINAYIIHKKIYPAYVIRGDQYYGENNTKDMQERKLR